MSDTVRVEPPPSPSPTRRKPGTFTAETARKAAQASVQARALKAQRLTEPDVPAPLPLPADVHGKTGGVVVSLPRTESPLTRLGDESREKLAEALNAQVKLLAEQAPKKRDELTGRDGTAQASKTLADALSVVHGWGEGTLPGLIVFGKVSSCPPPGRVTTGPAAGQPVIDVEPVPEPKPSLGAGPLTSEPAGSR